MSYQCLEQDNDWEEEFDKMLIALPILGTCFKKSYFDHLQEHNVSKLVLPQNLVVSYYARTIEECERKTEEFELYDREIKERQLRGVYSEKELGRSKSRDSRLSDERQGVTEPLHEIGKARPMLESHWYLDLDEDGYPEPYVITIDETSKKVVRIVSRFDKVHTEQTLQLDKLTDRYKLIEVQIQTAVQSLQQPSGQESTDQVRQAQELEAQLVALREEQNQLKIEMQALSEDNQKNPKVVRIETQEYYTKYGFIPSPDGGFYDLGLGALLGPINESINTAINQLMDSGTLNNGSHGFIGRGARIQGGKIRFTDPFEWKRVNVSGQSLRDSLVPLPVNPPSGVLFDLLSLLISYGERISSVNDAMTGSNPGQNTPAYSFHAMLEQGLQVFNGIFKRVYRAQRKEFKKLFLLNRTYLNPIEYFETIDGVSMQVLQNDYSGDEKDVMPAADPNAFSNMESLMKAHFIAERMVTVPGYNTVKGERLLLEAMDIPNVQELYPIDESGNLMIQPPPNMEMELKVAEEQRRGLESKARQETNAALAESTMDVNESVILLNQVKAEKLDSDVAVERFNAIHERAEKRQELLLKKLEILNAQADKGSSD